MFSEPRSVHNLGIHTTFYTFSDTDTEIFKHSLARSEPFLDVVGRASSLNGRNHSIDDVGHFLTEELLACLTTAFRS